LVYPQALDETDIEQWVGLLYYATSLATNGKFVLEACSMDSNGSNEKVEVGDASAMRSDRMSIDSMYSTDARGSDVSSIETGRASIGGQEPPQTRLRPALSTGADLPHSWQQGAITALMTTSASAVIHEGWLVKSSVSLKKRKRVWAWKKRYFTLTTESQGLARLHYYTSETMNHLKGHVDITPQTTVDPLDKNTGTGDGTGKGRAHCIRIASFSLELIVQAATESERSDWLAVLTAPGLLDGPTDGEGNRISAQMAGSAPPQAAKAAAAPEVASEPEFVVEDQSDGWKSAKGRRVVAKPKTKVPLADRLKAGDPSVRLARPTMGAASTTMPNYSAMLSAAHEAGEHRQNETPEFSKQTSGDEFDNPLMGATSPAVVRGRGLLGMSATGVLRGASEAQLNSPKHHDTKPYLPRPSALEAPDGREKAWSQAFDTYSAVTAAKKPGVRGRSNTVDKKGKGKAASDVSDDDEDDTFKERVDSVSSDVGATVPFGNKHLRASRTSVRASRTELKARTTSSANASRTQLETVSKKGVKGTLAEVKVQTQI
jgi:hypothetical protein